MLNYLKRIDLSVFRDVIGVTPKNAKRLIYKPQRLYWTLFKTG